MSAVLSCIASSLMTIVISAVLDNLESKYCFEISVALPKIYQTPLSWCFVVGWNYMCMSCCETPVHLQKHPTCMLYHYQATFVKLVMLNGRTKKKLQWFRWVNIEKHPEELPIIIIIIAKTKDAVLMSSRDHPKSRHDLHQNINGH